MVVNLACEHKQVVLRRNEVRVFTRHVRCSGFDEFVEAREQGLYFVVGRENPRTA